MTPDCMIFDLAWKIVRLEGSNVPTAGAALDRIVGADPLIPNAMSDRFGSFFPEQPAKDSGVHITVELVQLAIERLVFAGWLRVEPPAPNEVGRPQLPAVRINSEAENMHLKPFRILRQTHSLQLTKTTKRL